MYFSCTSGVRWTKRSWVMRLGAMNEMASGTAWLSAFIKGWQSGKVQQYALYFFGGVMLLAVLFIYVLR